MYLQVQAAIPSGYRVQFGGPVEEDPPRLPDGRIPPRRLARNGSLASPHIREYVHTLIRDLIQNYPDLDGLRVDWPEYPPYLLDSIFLDFSDPAREAARRLGFDFEEMRREVGQRYDTLHGGLTDDHLLPWMEGDRGWQGLLRRLGDFPGLADWIRFKAVLAAELLQGFRQVMNEAGGHHMELLPNAFPPPWTLASGMDFRRVAPFSTAISVKLYTMHWPMMLRFYADRLLETNPGLSDSLLRRALVCWLDIADDEGLARLQDYHYPEPQEPHPVGSRAQARKIRQAQLEAGPTPILALAHGYGPLDDFRHRLRVAHEASLHGLWVNRYGYLSDEKLEAIREVTG